MEVLKNLKKYKKSRNRIKILKIKFKKEISMLRTDMASFRATLPEEDLEMENKPETAIINKKVIDKKIKKALSKNITMPKTVLEEDEEEYEEPDQDTTGLEDELKAIKEKLASLG